jgi:hypothetical protein
VLRGVHHATSTCRAACNVHVSCSMQRPPGTQQMCCSAGTRYCEKHIIQATIEQLSGSDRAVCLEPGCGHCFLPYSNYNFCEAHGGGLVCRMEVRPPTQPPEPNRPRGRCGDSSVVCTDVRNASASRRRLLLLASCAVRAWLPQNQSKGFGKEAMNFRELPLSVDLLLPYQ